MSSQILEVTASQEAVEREAVPKKKPYTVIENIKGQRTSLIPPDYVDDDAINLPANAIKVLEKRSSRGKVKLAHILISVPANASVEVAATAKGKRRMPIKTLIIRRTIINRRL